MKSINDAPAELAVCISEFWPAEEWDNAASIAYLESNWNAFAENDTRTPDTPCGTPLDEKDGVAIVAEWSLGYFQINACNLPPDWTPQHLYNARHNAGTAHDYWVTRGWWPWYFSAKKLGLLS